MRTGVAFALLLLVAQAGAADSSSVRFKHISRDQGLSQSFVYSIAQDHEGFLWVGTQDGLNRFDGFEFTVFVPDPDDPGAISDETIRTMIADSTGALWIGTDAGGLSRYNSTDRTFTNYLHDAANPQSLSDNRVRVVYEGGAGILWVGTDGSGLDRFDRATETFEHYPHDPANADSLAGTSVWGVLESSDGSLYVATDNGLSKFDADSKTFAHYRHEPTDVTTISDNRLRVLFEDTDNNIWIGTESGGLNQFDRGSGSFHHFVHDPADASSISADRINTIFQDDAGVLWIGTVNGLNAWNPESGNFTRYANNAGDRYSLSNNTVSAIYQDRSGVLWIGTYDGLNCWNQASRTMLHFRNDANDQSSLNENNVMSFAESKDGGLWVASYGGGLNLLDWTTGRFREIRHVPGDDTSLSSDLVTSLLVDGEGVLWVGTRASGLNRYDAKSNTFAQFQHDPVDPSSVSADGVTYLLEDSGKTLWIATFGGGLNRFDRESQAFTSFRNKPDDPTSLSNDRVLLLFEDSGGAIWVGTYGGGLNRFDPESETFVAYRADPQSADGLSGDDIYMLQEDSGGDLWIGVKGGGLHRWRRADRDIGRAHFQKFGSHDGLPSTTIYSGAWDSDEHLWLGTGHGLSMLNTKTLTFRNYDASHGLQGDEYNFAAGYAMQDGRLVFGGVNGFNAFYPNLLRGRGRPPQVAITRFLRLNTAVNPQDLADRDGQVQLEHDQNVIGFEFAALDFVAPARNRFKYMLEGLDKSWADAGTKRQVTYTNLPAGKYTFRVMAANSDGVWSEAPASFSFYMRPAIWRTWWAYLVYAMAFLAVAFALLRANAKRARQAARLRHAEDISVIHTRMHDAQRIAHIGNWELNAHTRELWWSDEIYRLFQVDPEKVAATYDLFLQLVHADDREAVNEAVMSALAGPEPYAIDHRIVLPDGTERIMHSRAEVTLDDDGAAVRMAGTVHDITERKRAEVEIRHKADYQAMLAEISSRLIAARSEDIDDKVAYGLKLVGTQCDLDSVSIWWIVDDKKHAFACHRWERGGKTDKQDRVLRSEVPWLYEQLMTCNAVVIDDVNDMPADAAVDQSMLRRRGRKSVLMIPLRADKILEGCCIFAMTRHKRSWPAETVAELKLISENLGVALARLRAVAEIEQLKEKLQEENLYLRDKITLAHGFDEIIGEDPALKRCLMAVEKVAPTSVPVLILGETGTGKELIARAVHKISPRRDKPLVSVNCPALPAELIESELFGHEKGAFTGAQAQRRGRFELADTGTLFLDEVGELPLELQSKLLRVLQTGEYVRLGGSETLFSDVRLIAATNRDLQQLVEQGKFRSDLYYRISSFPIQLPALRDRKGDIPLLAEHFVQKHAERLGRQVNAISAKMIRSLVGYQWPGNIRELESTIERALISQAGGDVLGLPDTLPWTRPMDGTKPAAAQEDWSSLMDVERAHIVSVLEQCGWKISGSDGAAATLGMPPSTLRSRIKRLGIRR